MSIGYLYHFWWALLVAAGLLLLPRAAMSTTTTQPNPAVAHVKLCYFFFGSISDLGWTYTYNQGRLAIHQELVEAFPNVTFESEVFPNVFFTPQNHRRHTIIGYITGRGCTVVLTNNDQLLGGRSENDYFAAQFPNVSFVLLGEPWLSDHAFPNRVYIANDYTGGYYVAGAAAGAQSQSCIAFFAAWDTETDPTSSFAGFLLGVRRVNETIPVHVISQNSWFDPTSDRLLTDLFVGPTMGCDVIARFSDSYTVDVRVADSAIPGTFSIGSHSNLQQFVGDSVLTSVYVDWRITILRALRSLLINGTLNQDVIYFPGFCKSAITVAEMSPAARQGVVAAAEDAAQHLRESPNIVCGQLRLRNGGYLAYPSPNTSSMSMTNCKIPESNIGDFIVDAFTVPHPAFQQPTLCAAGTYYVYTFSPTNGALGLRCVPCPIGTYTPVEGFAACLPCAVGYESKNLGATQCSSVPLLSSSVIASIVVGGVAAIIAVVAVSLWQYNVYTFNSVAPREAPLCLLITDVEGGAILWRTDPELMAKVSKQHADIIRGVIANNHAYEVSKTGDRFVIATQSALDGMIVALEIQRELMAAVWPPAIPHALWPTLPNSHGRRRDGRHSPPPPSMRTLADHFNWNGPRVSIGLLHCRAHKTVISYRVFQQRYMYRGADPDAAAVLGAIAQGGQIAVTQETLDAVMADPHYDLILSHDAHIRLWGQECHLHHRHESRPPSAAPPVPSHRSTRVDNPLAVEGSQKHLTGEQLQRRDLGDTNEPPPCPSTTTSRHNKVVVAHPTTGSDDDDGESTTIYSVMPAELSGRNFEACPIGRPPLRAADMAIPRGADSLFSAIPGLSHEGQEEMSASSQEMSVPERIVLPQASVAVLVSRLLQWVGPSHRRSLVHILLHRLGVHNLERHAEWLQQQKPDTNARAEMASESAQSQVVCVDPSAPRWRNPKRLAASIAVALHKDFDEL